MRNYHPTIFLMIFWFCGNSYSQSLNFNRVIIVHANEDTVPVGKVWKVESFMQRDANVASGTTTNCLSSNIHPIVINGLNYFLIKDTATGLSTSLVLADQKLPFWLPAGYRLKTMCTDDFLSVIEFTVTP